MLLFIYISYAKCCILYNANTAVFAHFPETHPDLRKWGTNERKALDRLQLFKIRGSESSREKMHYSEDGSWRHLCYR